MSRLTGNEVRRKAAFVGRVCSLSGLAIKNIRREKMSMKSTEKGFKESILHYQRTRYKTKKLLVSRMSGT